MYRIAKYVNGIYVFMDVCLLSLEESIQLSLRSQIHVSNIIFFLLPTRLTLRFITLH